MIEIPYKVRISSLEISTSILPEKGITSNYNKNEESPDEDKETQDSEIKLQETKSLFAQVSNLYDRYEVTKKAEEDLLSQKKKEIEEITKIINKSYSEKINKNSKEISTIKNDLNIFGKLIEKYSIFDIDLIGNTLQKLITLMENEEFLYEQVVHNLKRRVYGIMEKWDEDEQTKVKIIISKDKFLPCYNSASQYENEISELVKNGDAILLSERDVYSRIDDKNIKIYTWKEGKITCLVDFSRFDYVKEFINKVIEYRFQNNILELTEKEMMLLLLDFISNYNNINTKNNNSLVKEKTLKLN